VEGAELLGGADEANICHSRKEELGDMGKIAQRGEGNNVWIMTPNPRTYQLSDRGNSASQSVISLRIEDIKRDAMEYSQETESMSRDSLTFSRRFEKLSPLALLK